MGESSWSFDVREIPFARRGSWIDLSPVIGLHRSAPNVHLVSHQTGMHPVFEFVPTRAGEPVAVTVTATPASLSWADARGSIEATFESADTLRIRGAGLGLRLVEAARALTPFSGAYLITDPVDGAFVLTTYETGRRYRVTVLSGSASATGDGALGDADRRIDLADDEPWEIALEEFETARPAFAQSQAFDDVVAAAAEEFDAYHRALAPSDAPASVKAAYVLWSATVAPSGFFAREAILMSKHWMDKVWSWDHCFNALALAAADVDAALDQFLLPFDHQDTTGALPDSVAHSELLYNYVKPPIHGWAFQGIRARATRELTTAELTTVYDRLASWTGFWLRSRRAPGHRLPYYQHGNDSGWDNSTTFDADRVIESPDLAAFLILQLDTLADLALELSIADQEWSALASDLEAALLEQLWTGDRFIARSATTGEASSTTSLLNALPIVLGQRLPHAVAQHLATQIESHLTEWGPATELVESDRYEADGYWRGPIWAPSTALIEDGLRRAGFAALADTISARFQALCERSGFAENFDAISGAGLRDRAYTWTASAYLVLASDTAARERELMTATGEA